MKPLHQLNIEEFRVRYDLTIEQVSEMLQLPVSKYESVTHKMLVHYSYHPEIKEFFMEGMDAEIKKLCKNCGVTWCETKGEIIANTLICNSEKANDSMRKLSRSFMKKSISV